MEPNVLTFSLDPDGYGGVESGGQCFRILIAYLTIYALPGLFYVLTHIRKGRSDGGGCRAQHALIASQFWSKFIGDVEGETPSLLKSKSLTLSRNADFVGLPSEMTFNIDTAASTTLILQCLFMSCVNHFDDPEAHSISVSFIGGGTHTGKSPILEHVQYVLCPLLASFFKVSWNVEKLGFFPKGGAKYSITLSAPPPETHSMPEILDSMSSIQPEYKLIVSKSLYGNGMTSAELISGLSANQKLLETEEKKKISKQEKKEHRKLIKEIKKSIKNQEEELRCINLIDAMPEFVDVEVKDTGTNCAYFYTTTPTGSPSGVSLYDHNSSMSLEEFLESIRVHIDSFIPGVLDEHTADQLLFPAVHHVMKNKTPVTYLVTNRLTSAHLESAARQLNMLYEKHIIVTISQECEGVLRVTVSHR